MVERFLAAIRTGDVDGLLSVLAPDVVAVGDGGGLAPAARLPIKGAQRVAKSLLLVARTEGFSVHSMWVNGALAITIEHDGKRHAVASVGRRRSHHRALRGRQPGEADPSRSGDTAGHLTCHTSTMAGALKGNRALTLQTRSRPTERHSRESA